MGKKSFTTHILLWKKNEPIIYMYSEKDYKYNKLSLKEFAELVKNGFTSIQGNTWT